MSKEEFLKIQTCVLKVNIHCEGCKQKVKKILQKIDGVYTTSIDSEQGKVTVSGNVDPATLIKKLTKNGKKAELWGAPKGNTNNGQNKVNNQFKNLQIDRRKGGNNNNNNKGGQAGQKGGNGNQPKVGGQNPQIKGFQDLKLPPQFGNGGKEMKLPQMNGKEQKPGKVMLPPEDEGLSEDEYDEFYDDEDDDYYDDDDDDGLDDEFDDVSVPGKMKPQMPNMMMAGQQQLIKPNNGKKGAAGAGGGGGGGIIPVQMNLGGGGDVKGGAANGGKKGNGGGNGNGNNNQNQGGGGGKGGKNGGGQPQNGNKNGGGAAGNFAVNGGGGGGKEGGGMNHGSMPNMIMPTSGGVGPVGNMPVGHMGNPPMSQMGNLAAVQGLPAMGGGGGSGGGGATLGAGPGYFQGPAGGGGNPMAGNPYYQQQLAAMMMNQQRPNGNEQFQPMIYARPPPAVNYMPPYLPYPYAPMPGERADQYSMFSDENPASCTLM